MSFLFFHGGIAYVCMVSEESQKTAIAYGIVYVIACLFYALSYIPKEVVLQKASDKDLTGGTYSCAGSPYRRDRADGACGSDAKGIQKDLYL